MKSKILNKKGYTLTYAIIIIAILLILTSSITMVTYFNFRLAKIGGDVNTSFYANDGAIEEAITELSIFTHNAEIEAWDQVENGTVYNTVEWELFVTAIHESITSGELTYIEANELVSFAYKRAFEELYYRKLLKNVNITNTYFNDSLTGIAKYYDYPIYTGITLSNKASGDLELKPSIVTQLTNTEFDPQNIVSADASPVISLEPIAIVNNNSISLTIKSDGTYHSYNKKLSVSLLIKPPEYTVSVSTLTDTAELHKNEITNFAVVANKDLIFAEGATNIEGDVYAFGSNVDGLNNKNRNKYGGVVVGYLDDSTSLDRVYGSSYLDSKGNTDLTSNVTVDGDLITRSSVKVETNSNLTVSNNIYANAFYVRNNSTSSTIDVLRNMYLYTDLFIGGNNTSIKLGEDGFKHPSNIAPPDSVYNYLPDVGLLWGLHSENNEIANEYTRTGSIIISKNAENPSITMNGMALGGVIRYDMYDKNANILNSNNKVAYKTGESFTTYDNREYYHTLMNDSIYQTGIFSILKTFIASGNEYELVSFKSDLSAQPNQIGFRALHFFNMGYLAYLNSSSPEPNIQNLYKMIDPLDKKILKFRDRDKVTRVKNDTDEQFLGISSIGLLQFSDSSKANGKTYHPELISNIPYTDKKNIVDKEMDRNINFLGYRNNITKNTVNLFQNGWLDLTASKVNKKEGTRFSYINTDEDVDLYLNFDNVIVGQDNQQSNNLSGSIVTRGNIFINANSGETFNFTGNIISAKNIYFVGSGYKNIIHDEDIIYSTINSDDSFKKLYYTNTGRMLLTSESTINDNFVSAVTTNNDVIILNYVSDTTYDGTNKLVDSNSITIVSWIEAD